MQVVQMQTNVLGLHTKTVQVSVFLFLLFLLSPMAFLEQERVSLDSCMVS